jgi:hypothetical protein
MAVDQKIDNAEYFLNKIRNAKKREDIIPNISAFLSETTSIPDYLLEDYNLKYGLGIKRMYKNTFIEQAIIQKNQGAIRFIIEYISNFNELKKDPVVERLWHKRNVQVHSKHDPLQANFSVNLPESVPDNDSVDIEVRDKDGNLTTKSGLLNKIKSGVEKKIKSISELKKQSTTRSMTMTWFFTDYKDRDVVDLCETYLKLTKSFINHLRNEFPYDQINKVE